MTSREIDEHVIDFVREKSAVLEYCANLPRAEAERQARAQAAVVRVRLHREAQKGA